MVTTTRLFLTGIRAAGRHGANPGEKDEPQEFVVDLDVEVEVTGDDIHRTADYRRVVSAARDTVSQESFDLLETLAQAVSAAVQGLEGVVHVTAVVHKPAAAASLGIQGVAAAAGAGDG
ncbi:MAG: dihydroneopterin aldolase [Actinomycetota bacterium]